MIKAMSAPLRQHQVHAHRRHQCQEPERLSLLLQDSGLAAAAGWSRRISSRRAILRKSPPSRAKRSEQMLGFELAHIGINASSADEAENIAGAFSSPVRYAEKDREQFCLRRNRRRGHEEPLPRQNGHIAVATNYIDRAVNYLSMKGVAFNEESAKRDAKGNLTAIYLKDEIGGFAVHLVQKK